MKRFEHSAARLSLTLALLAATQAGAQQGVPPGLRLQPNGGQKPSAATPLTTPLPPSAPTAPAPLPQQQPQRVAAATGRRARVDYSGGLLTINADNSSLNQILREIARQTGIKITGGVTDERVFGTYGPTDLPTILAVLLDGTGSNMMLSGDTPGVPQMLTLTPRQGGATPPSPDQVQNNDDLPPPAAAQDLPPQLTPRTANDSIGQSAPVNPPQPQPFSPPTAQPDATTTTAPAANTTTDQSPNGVKTPQQIYDQLMKLQSQQPKPQ